MFIGLAVINLNNPLPNTCCKNAEILLKINKKGIWISQGGIIDIISLLERGNTLELKVYNVIIVLGGFSFIDEYNISPKRSQSYLSKNHWWR